jgi:quercetin 2,3-dioxygenase
MLTKKVIKNTPLQFKQDFPGLKGITTFASEYSIEPFLVFTEYYMSKQVFGPHPHAGVSVMTYLLPDSQESFINRDSLGNFNTIEPGGLHITQSGSGMHHDEFPKNENSEAHGFQIWINHSEQNRMVEPKAIPVAASEVKEFTTNDYKVRLIHGKFNQEKSNYQMITNVTLLHVYLQPNKTIVLNAEEMAFAFILNGNGNSDNQEFANHGIINFDTIGNQVEITAGNDGLEFMFGTGQPLNEPITYGGPFVMTTEEQMHQTRLRLGKGLMGTLEKYQY